MKNHQRGKIEKFAKSNPMNSRRCPKIDEFILNFKLKISINSKIDQTK